MTSFFQNWIVGKYGRVLPVVHVKKARTMKVSFFYKMKKSITMERIFFMKFRTYYTKLVVDSGNLELYFLR